MKLRKEDNIKKKHTYNLAIFSLLFVIIFLLILKSVPKFFISSSNLLSSMTNPFMIRENNKAIKNLIEDKNKIYSNKVINIDQNSLKNILAKSYVIYDVNNNKILASKNENVILPLASLTKIVSAISAINLRNRNTLITIEKEKMGQDETLDLGLYEGQVWKLADLLKYALTISSNASMDIIASTIMNNSSDFVDYMNNYVKSLGFSNFKFNSVSGLDYGNLIGGSGTSYEYAKLFAEAYKLIPDILTYTIHSRVDVKSTNENIFSVPNTNKEASESLGLLASKTGFTDLAGGNLAIMLDYGLNRTFVIVVLGSTVEGRFTDINILSKALKEALY